MARYYDRYRVYVTFELWIIRDIALAEYNSVFSIFHGQFVSQFLTFRAVDIANRYLWQIDRTVRYIKFT